jgi:putative oxidoreductase
MNHSIDSKVGTASSMKSIARLSLLVGLCLQTGWLVWVVYGHRAPWSLLIYPIIITALFAGLAFANGRLRRLNAIVRIVLGLAFLLSVADRFGLMGAYGSPGVSFGDYAHFVAYTRQVNSFLPESWAPTLAALATSCEATIGTALILGVSPRNAVLAALALLLVFGTAMSISLGLDSHFPYAVVVLTSGAWFLSTLDCSAWSIEAWRRRAKQSEQSNQSDEVQELSPM